MSVVLLGIGNTLLCDDGFGPLAIERLREAGLPPGVHTIDAGTAVMRVRDEIAGASLLLVFDALASGRPPGSLMRLADAEVPRFFAQGLSAHQSGLSDLLATLALAGESPRRLVVIGVEPASLAMSCGLSPAVEAALPAALQLAREEIERHLRPAAP